MDATDLLKMWKNKLSEQEYSKNQKTWIKALDLYSIPLQNWTWPTALSNSQTFSHPIISKLDSILQYIILYEVEQIDGS